MLVARSRTTGRKGLARARGIGGIAPRPHTLGGFEGRVSGVGPDIIYTLMCGKIPVSTELKVFHEFDVENRAKGNAGMFTVSLPLSAGGQLGRELINAQP